MGGGSMNAATILNFFLKKGLLKLNQTKIYAKKISSDVILGLKDRAKILYSNGNMKEIKNKIKYTVLLVKPFYGCSTKKIFAINKTFSKRQYFFNKTS